MRGVWNERLGWLLLLAGFLTAIGLDPWSLSEGDPVALLGSVRMAVRHAQGVVLAMGFLQIAVARLLVEGTLPERLCRVAGPVLAVGSLVYAAGYVGVALRPGFAWLIPFGATVNLFGFALLGWTAWRAPVAAEVRAVLAIFLFGMAIDVVSGLVAVNPTQFLPAYVGPEDGVRQRMLRLARVAATALSLLTLLSRDLWPPNSLSLLRHWGRLGMLVGTLGMPTILTAACFVWIDIKYLLPIPALAMTGGVLLALLAARRMVSPLEQWGWLVIAASMSVGLFVGFYAFDGPLPAPAFVGGYNEFVRRLIRLGHAYCIVLGLLAVLLGRQGAGRLAAGLLVAGSCLTLLSIGLLAFMEQPTALLAPGPAVVALALIFGVHWLRPHGSQPRDVSCGQVPEKEPEPSHRPGDHS